MKKIPFHRWLLIPAGALLLMAAGYNPGTYPLRYVSGETSSGVITFQPALLVGCEVANGSASAQNYMFYDAQSVPANNFNTACTATSAHPCMAAYIYQCPSKTTCYWNPAGPNSVQGGVGVPMALGIAWSNSSTFPKKTIGANDSVVSCSYQVYSMGPPPAVRTPTATAPAPTPTATPFPM